MIRHQVVLFLACFILVGALAPAGAAPVVASSASSTGHEAATAVVAQEEIDPDDVLMAVEIENDGDATWTIEYRLHLETDEDRQAFENLREDVETDPEPYAERFRERMEATAENAATATGREMTIADVSVFADREDLPRERGVVTYTFRWTNFAATDGDRLIVGDAIDGLYLESDTALQVSWSDRYELVDASPTPDRTSDRSATWTGPTTFAGGEPRVELGSPGAVGAVVAVSSITIAVLAGVMLVVGAGAFAFYRRRTNDPPTVGRADTERGETPSGRTDEVTPDSKLLSNEEQVLQLIERNGGRMKQQAVAEALGWTDAKTSQVTKKLREAGDLEGFRLGRENVLSLPDDTDETDERS